jgi:hypothetical protein
VFKTWHLENYWRAINWVFQIPGFCPVMWKGYPCNLFLWLTRPDILTLSAWSPIILKRKLTYLFLISVQLEAHSISWQLACKLLTHTTISSSDFYHFILTIFFIQRWPSLHFSY